MGQIERQPDSFAKRVKGLPSKIGRSIGDRLRTNNPLSPELTAEAVGTLVNVGIEDPKTANILQAVAKGTAPIGTSTQARPRTRPITEGRPTPDKKGDHKLRNIVLATGATVVAGASAVAAGQHHFEADEPISLPGITRDIQAIPGQVAEWFYQGYQTIHQGIIDKSYPSKIPDVPAPPTFDNRQDMSIVEAGVNAVPATTGDIEKLAKNNILPSSKDNPLPEIIIRLPGALQPGDRVQINRIHPVTGFEMPTGEKIPNTSLVVAQEVTYARKGTPIDSGIIDNEAENIEVFRELYVNERGEEYITGAYIFVKRKDGSKYSMHIVTSFDIRALKPLNSINDAPILEWETIREGNHNRLKIKPNQKGKSVDLSTPMFATDHANASVRYYLDSYTTTDGKVIFFGNVSVATNSNNQLIYQPQKKP